MIKTFTQDDVVRYVYEETSAEDNLIVEDSLMAEPGMMSFFLETIEMRAMLSKIEREPRQSTIDSILNYSRNYA